jgi:hypothetical protein
MAGWHDPDPGSAGRPGAGPLRVFISYAHDDQAHIDRVRDFWLFLRAHGVDARLDLLAGEQPVGWTLWAARGIRDADRVLVVVSPEYRRRADGDAGPAEGRGVHWEAARVRERLDAGHAAGMAGILPVVLPGCSPSDIPAWLTPAAAPN